MVLIVASLILGVAADAATAHVSATRSATHATHSPLKLVRGVGRVHVINPTLLALPLRSGQTLLTHGPDPALPSDPQDLAFTSPEGSTKDAPGSGDGTSVTYVCQFSVDLTLSPSAYIFGLIYIWGGPEDQSGTYSGSTTGTCNKHDAGAVAAPQTISTTLAFDGQYESGGQCPTSFALGGTVHIEGAGHGTDMSLDGTAPDPNNSTITVDSQYSTPIQNSGVPCKGNGGGTVSSLHVQGRLMAALDSVSTSTADGPDPCTLTACDDGPTDPDPCGLTPCDSPPDPCASVDCSVTGASATVRKPHCVTDPANPSFRAYYIHPTDRPSRYRHYLTVIRTLIARMNTRLYDEAKRSSGGAQAARYRFLCDSKGRVTVGRYRYTHRDGANKNLYSQVVNDAQAAGLSSTAAKYLIFYDGRMPRVKLPNGDVIRACGQGDVPTTDDSHTATSRNNSGPDYAVVYSQTCFEARYAMHETAHNMGAVQNSAPHSSGGFHCNDGQDVMCYADGGSKSHYNPNVCSQLRFDCNHDDYFDTQAGANSYLGTHWNLGWSANKWLTFP